MFHFSLSHPHFPFLHSGRAIVWDPLRSDLWCLELFARAWESFADMDLSEFSVLWGPRKEPGNLNSGP